MQIKMQILTSTAFILLLCSFALGRQALSQKYKFSAQLSGDDYVLYWSANLESNQIEFAVNVSTTGWVGFGLSPNGQMPGSDVVIGWVDNIGKVTFHVSLLLVCFFLFVCLYFVCLLFVLFHIISSLQDRFATTRGLPAIDSSQDWFISSGSEENGRTVLEFYRNFTSCDDNNDMDIKVSSIIYSINKIIFNYCFDRLTQLVSSGHTILKTHQASISWQNLNMKGKDLQV